MPLRIIGDSYYSYNNQLAADNEQSLSEQFTLDYLDDPRVAATIAANQNRYNHLTPGIALALGKAGQGPDSPLTQAASQAAAQRKSEKSSWGGLGSVLGVALPALGKIIHTALYPFTTPTARAAIRYPMAAFQAGTEALDNLGVNAARLIKDEGIFKGTIESAVGLGSGMLLHPEKTTLGHHILEGKSIGTGYFASGQAHQAADEYRRTVYEMEGYTPNLGRVVASTMFEPGTAPWKLVSGAVDFVKATKVDPGYNALKAYSNFRKAGTVLSEASRADAAERLAAGLIDHTPRVTVDDNRVMQWMHNVEEGQKFVRTATDLDSPYKIMRTFKGIDTETARLLSETRTDPETMAVISDRYLTGRLSEIPSKRLPLTIRDNPAAQLRIWQSIPRDNIAHYNDLDQTAHLLEAHLLNAKMSPDAIEYHFNRLLYTANPGEWHQVLNNAMEDAALRVAGQVDHTGTVTSTGKALGIGQKVYLNDRNVLGEVVNLKSEEKVGRTLDRAIGAVDEVPYTEHQAVVRVPSPHGEDYLTVPVDTLSTHTPVSWVRSMFRHARQVAAEEAGHAVDEVADGTPRGKILTGDGVVDIGTAHPTAEALTSTYIFPNIREVRRLSSAYGRLLATTPLGVLPDIGDGFNKVWRPLKLFSIASGIRALSEDQMRVAVSGGQSFFNHPIRTLQVIIGKRGDVSNLIQDSQEVQQVLAHGGGAWLDRGVTQFSKTVRSHEPEFARALSNKLTALHTDELVRNLVTRPLAEVKNWFWDSEAPRLRALLHEDIKPRPYLTSRAAADKYVDDMLSHVEHHTAGDRTLLEALATGKMRIRRLVPGRQWTDEEIAIFTKSLSVTEDEVKAAQSFDPQQWDAEWAKWRDEETRLFNKSGDEYRHAVDMRRVFQRLIDNASLTFAENPAFVEQGGSLAPTDPLVSHIRSRAGDTNFVPHVDQERPISAPARKRLDNAVNNFFGALYSVPFKKLTATPFINGEYWDRTKQLIPLMSPDAQAEAIKFARDANMPRSFLRELAAESLRSNGDLMFHEAHQASKIYAVNKAKELFYDLHDKSQFGDIWRHFSPFFDVWRDSLKTWAKLLAKNPAPIRRFQLAVTNSRSSGFFSTDPNTGEETFNYPGSEFVSRHFTNGIPVPLQASAGSLNQILSGTTPLLPSVGPIVQIPAGKLIANIPSNDWIRNYLFPYGETSLSGSLTPNWVKPILDATGLSPDSARKMGDAQKDAARALMSTGEYDPSNPTEMRALEDKSWKLAKSIMVYRGLAGLTLPAAPHPDWQAQDPNGVWLSHKKMADIMHKFESDPSIGYDDAATAFIKLFGDKNLLFLQGKYETRSPQDRATYDWARSNPELVRAYPDAYQYFAPRSGERAPYEAFMSGLDSGVNRPLTFKEWTERANDRVASMIYYNTKDLIGPKPAPNQTAYLRGLRQTLTQAFPGFDPEAADPKRRQRTIDQFYTAAQDPKVLTTTDAGKGISLYLTARDQAIQSAAKGKIIGWQSAKSTRNIRTWLRQIARQIIAQHPDFENVWDKVFEGEMVNDG